MSGPLLLIPRLGEDDYLPPSTSCPDAFFEDAPAADRLMAKRVCRTCPVSAGCEMWAMTHNEHGIWAGMTVKERRSKARSSRRRAARKEQR